MCNTHDLHTIYMVVGFLFDLFVSWDFLMKMTEFQIITTSMLVFLCKHRIEHYFTRVFGDAFKGKEYAIAYIVMVLTFSFIPFLGMITLTGLATNYALFFDEHIATT